jgi:hypothetical protein
VRGPLVALLLWAFGPGRAAEAAFERLPIGIRDMALSGAGVGLMDGSDTGVLNPAGLGGAGKRILSVAYTPSPFGLDDLRRSALAFVEPFSWGAVGVSAQIFGCALYRETTVAAECAVEVVPGCWVGVRCAVMSLRIQDYGADATLGVDAGFVLRLSSLVDLGGAVGNLNAPSIGEFPERLPQTITLGLTFHPTSAASLCAAIYSDQLFSPEFRFGVEYSPLPEIILRGGICQDPPSYTAGFGFSYSGFVVEYAYRVHRELGGSHAFGLTVVLE